MARRKVNYLYSTYRFIDGEQDPSVDRFRAALQITGKSPNEVADDSRLARSTVRSWVEQKTKKPQFATMAAALGAVGIDVLGLIDTALEERRKANH